MTVFFFYQFVGIGKGLFSSFCKQLSDGRFPAAGHSDKNDVLLAFENIGKYFVQSFFRNLFTCEKFRCFYCLRNEHIKPCFCRYIFFFGGIDKLCFQRVINCVDNRRKVFEKRNINGGSIGIRKHSDRRCVYYYIGKICDFINIVISYIFEIAVGNQILFSCCLVYSCGTHCFCGICRGFGSSARTEDKNGFPRNISRGF